MANNSISLVSLDFDTIKYDLTTYLKNQSQFADYDFTGSNMSVLLDILSYNTYLNSFYINMAVNEMFLDSAQLQSSVVSLAKTLNYTPRSYKSSRNTVSCQFPQGSLSSLTIPAGTRFAAQNGSGNYTFVTRQSSVLYPSGGYFTINNLMVYEGKYLTDTFVVDNTVQNQRFILSNQQIDTDSLNIIVSENNGANVTTFAAASSLLGLDSTSAVYFIQATQNNYYEIVFGDGVFGRIPLNNATVFANYMNTTGTDADGSTNFNLVDVVAAAPNSITTATTSYSGANAESIESIRYNAPRSYQTQERAVTVNDYKQLILQNYSDIKNVHVYGGETLTGSVNFGTTFIVPATYSGYNLTLSEQADIQNFLLKRNVLGITPQLVNPTYLYLEIYSTVKYDPNQTTLSSAGIQAAVSSTIVSYNSTTLQNFDTEFRLSDFMTAITSTDTSISSNQTYAIMKKIISPQLNSPESILVPFSNAIKPGSFFSSVFLSGGVEYSYTDYNPNVSNFTFTQSVSGLTINNTTNVAYLQTTNLSGQTTYIESGTIDYLNGIVSLAQINITDFIGNSGVIFYASPSHENVMAFNNDIIEIDVVAGINITTETV
jgi:hypothetical protein